MPEIASVNRSAQFVLLILAPSDYKYCLSYRLRTKTQLAFLKNKTNVFGPPPQEATRRVFQKRSFSLLLLDRAGMRASIRLRFLARKFDRKIAWSIRFDIYSHAPSVTLTSESEPAMRLLLTGLFILIAGDASADWEGTRWGMTMEEVAVSLHSVIVPTDKNEERLYSQGNVGTAEFRFKYTLHGAPVIGHLLFRNKKLSGVLINILEKNTLPSIRRALVREYGNPTTKDIQSIEGCETIGYGFSDKTTNNTIVYYSRSCDDRTQFIGQVLYTSLHK